VIGVIGVIHKTCGTEAFKAGGTIHVIDEPHAPNASNASNASNATKTPLATDRIHMPDRIDGIDWIDGFPKASGTDSAELFIRRAGLDEISGSIRAKRAPGGARGRTVPASRRGGNRDLNAREAHKVTVRRVMSRGVGSCL
jgi:hypothetical protein